MPFPTPLDSDQLTLLRGASGTVPTYYAAQYAVFIPGVTVFQAQINGAPTGTSFVQVAYDTATGDYTDILADQTVYIGSTPDVRLAQFVGRTRANNTGVVATMTTLNINETSVPIQNNWYITVVRDWRIFDRLARQSGSTQYKDYDNAYRLPSPFITGLQSGYAGIASGSPEVLTLSFTPSATAIASGATINNSTWVWTVPSGVTIIIGSSTSQNITVEVDAGVKDWITVQVNDTNSKTGYFHFPVASVPSDFSDVVTLGMAGASIQRGDNGDASIEAFDGVEDLPDNCLVMLFNDESYSGTQTSIVSNVAFVGRIRTERDNTSADATYSLLKKATYDLEGALSQFGRVEHLPFTLLYKPSPTKFDEIKDLTVWRGIAYTLYWHTTFLTLHALSFDSTDNTFLYQGFPTQGGNILSVIQDLAVSINAAIEVAPTGETRVVRDAVYLTGAQRAALPTIFNGTMQDIINIDSLDITEIDTTGKIQGSGGFFNSISGKITSLLSLAPGVAQGIGESISSFTRQVLQANQTQAQAQTELNNRTGYEYAAKRRTVTTLSLTLPGGYNWIVPSRAQWYTWTIPATDITGGREYTTADRWQCTSVSIQQDNNTGVPTVQVGMQLETTGPAGQTVTYPPVTQIAPIIPVVPTIPGFPTFPPLPDIVLPPNPTNDDTPPYVPAPVSNGNTVAVFDATGNWIAGNVFYTNTPTWAEITPDDLTITDFQWLGLGSKGAYVLGNDGTDSMFFYTADAISPGAIWTATPVTGVYTKIRVGSTQGEVYIMSVEEDWCYTFDFTLTDGGFTVAGFGTYSPGVGWVETSAPLGAAINVTLGISPTTITSVSIDITFGSAGFGRNVSVRDDITMQVLVDYLSVASGPGTFSNSGLFTGIEQLVLNPSTGGGVYDSITITSLTICGTGPNPFGGGGSGIQTRYSTDNGEIFDPLESAGTSPGIFVGIDTQKVGTVALIGTSGQVNKAVSGGAWAAYGSAMPTGASPAAIWIPAKQFGGTTNNSGTNPEYLVASDVLTAGNEALWTVDTSGTVFTDITPSIGGVFGVAVSQDCVAMPFVNGNKIAAILDFGGDIHLVTSSNAGGSWTDRGILNAAANYIRFRRGDAQALQLFIANDDELTVSPSLGANLISKDIASNTIIGAEPF